MHWNAGAGAGFTTGNKTWLLLNENYKTVNVAVENAAVESHLKVYKDLMKLRYTDLWRYGAYESQSLNNDTVLAFTRSLSVNGESTGLLVLVSFSSTTQIVDASTFTNIPTFDQVLIRSVGFQNEEAIVGGAINTRSVQLGPRNSLVIQFTPKL